MCARIMIPAAIAGQYRHGPARGADIWKDVLREEAAPERWRAAGHGVTMTVITDELTG